MVTSRSTNQQSTRFYPIQPITFIPFTEPSVPTTYHLVTFYATWPMALCRLRKEGWRLVNKSERCQHFTTFLRHVLWWTRNCRNDLGIAKKILTQPYVFSANNGQVEWRLRIRSYPRDILMRAASPNATLVDPGSSNESTRPLSPAHSPQMHYAGNGLNRNQSSCLWPHVIHDVVLPLQLPTIRKNELIGTVHSQSNELLSADHRSIQPWHRNPRM